MGMFDNASKKAAEYLNKQGLSDLSIDVTPQVNTIKKQLDQSGFSKWLSKSTGQIDGAKLGIQQALVEQNWIIIKQNQAILDELKKINAK